MKDLISRILNYRSTADGASFITIVLSFWIAPEYAKEISTVVLTILGLFKIWQKDSQEENLKDS